MRLRVRSSHVGLFTNRWAIVIDERSDFLPSTNPHDSMSQERARVTMVFVLLHCESHARIRRLGVVAIKQSAIDLFNREQPENARS